MKIKITEPGWAGFSDMLGTTQFENGVSVDSVSAQEALRLGAILRIEEVNENGDSMGQVGATVEMVHNRFVPAEIEAPILRGEDEQPAAVEETPEPVEIEGDAPSGEVDALEANGLETQAPDSQDTPAASVKVWTREELEAIADAEGIKGLREVGTPMGAKNTSISKLIDEILAVQAAKAEGK